MEVGGPAFHLAVVVAGEIEAGAGVFEGVVLVGMFHHKRAGHVEGDFAAEALGKLLEQFAHLGFGKIHQHAFENKEHGGGGVALLQLFHPAGIECGGGDEGFVGLWRQQCFAQSNHVGQVELVEGCMLGGTAEPLAAAVEPAAENGNDAFGVAADKIGGHLVEIAGAQGCAHTAVTGGAESGEVVVDLRHKAQGGGVVQYRPALLCVEVFHVERNQQGFADGVLDF